MAAQNNQAPDLGVKNEDQNQNNPNTGDNQGHPNKNFQNRGRGAGRFGGRGGRGGGRFGGPQGPDLRIKQENFGGPRKRGPPGGPNQPIDGGRNDRIGDRDGGERGPRPMNDKVQERINQIGGPSYDIPPINTAEKKFNGRNRLYIGNIGNEVTEEDLTELFKSYGETSEIFLNKEKNFAFIKLDFHCNAEKAKSELDGTVLKSRNLKIRFAPNSTSIKIKNLTPQVSNELLHYAFAPFGEIERALVCVDERGKPTGEGIIDFARKGSALAAIRKCSEGCFFLTASLRPCIVEAYDNVDDNDGFPDKNINKKHPDYQKEREIGPRFANPGSFEHEYGTRWKQLHDLYVQKEQALKKELEMEKEKLEAQMEFARYEHETEMLREQLRAREMDRERQKREWEMKERQAEEQRQRTEEQMRRQQEEMENRMMAQEEEMRRRQQENNLFMQAHNLDNMLNQQEEQYDINQTNNYDTHNNMAMVTSIRLISGFVT
ncbi:hrp65 protein isoform X2 [Aethina tumida]|uniref:hrp65 protein isoform X2 n=1 Tax=Aethina tumida TaxID=116153 RepID=UPI002148B588|nr:hrp65 protein isoform X2 [Aethina tumida]